MSTPPQQPAEPVPRPTWNRERLLTLGLAVSLIVVRCLVFGFWPQASFDSDQAVIGLMAKHLSELRALPIFMYGQAYILGVEAWMAAPVFWIAGPSVAALKLPLIVINILVGVLLIVLLERETKLRPALGLVAVLFFLLPPPGTAATLVEASGGNLEPFLYVLLLWLTRERPMAFGAILAFGFLHRSFTIYGLGAILLLEAFDGTLFRPAHLRKKLPMLGSLATVWIGVDILKQFSSIAGPGTSLATVPLVPSSLAELVARFCWSATMIPTGLARIVTEHWPVLFGVRTLALYDFNIDSPLNQGAGWLWMVFAGLLLLMFRRATMGLISSRSESWPQLGRSRFCLYLGLVGLQSAAAYGVGRCGVISIHTLRYDLLSLLLPIGLVAWYLATERSNAWKIACMSLVVCWAVVSLGTHARLIAEYLHRPPHGAKREIANHLLARGIYFGTADYWIAYHVTFLTNERVILAATEVPRILLYGTIVAAHKDKSVRVSRTPCSDGEQIMRRVYLCKPE